MRPALILASAFLDDPTTLCLFHAMAVPAQNCMRMAHPDVSMGGTNAGSSTFSIPHAPKFPDGNLRNTAREFGARENPDGNSFEILMNDFPIQYRLGPPCKSMGWSEVVHKWGLQMLERAGFLNVDVLLADDWYMSPFGKFAAEVTNPQRLPDQRIHPVFWKDLWHKTTVSYSNSSST
ncbi:hypothetical protein D6C83_09458, partial [Aureobasidium pullulans]